jgi:hypothetical protein
VLYLRQAPGRRATLHRRIGERLERLFADGIGDVAAELAWHFEQGFDYDRATRYQRARLQQMLDRVSTRSSVQSLAADRDP